MCLALLALGEAAPAAFPVRVAIEAHGPALTVTVDGQRHSLTSALGGGWQAVAFEQPGPAEREYQIDGSDTTATNDRDPGLVRSWLGSPGYAFDAWLRDEASFSRWTHQSVLNLQTDQSVSSSLTLPADFRVEAALERPEAPAHLWLVGPVAGQREGLELDRDRRNARWVIDRNGARTALPRWFFPEQPMPFVADLLKLLGRSAAAGYALLLASLLLGRLRTRSAHASSPPFSTSSPPFSTSSPPFSYQEKGGGGDEVGAARPRAVPLRLLGEGVLGAWLIAAALVTTELYHQLPHILDAVSYTFQAGVFASGRLWLPAPPLVRNLQGPFQVVLDGRWFSQYPPGAPLAYALGRLVGLEWLVGPLACLALIGASSWAAGAIYGRGAGLVALLLGVLSPFVLFQAGSYLSHPIAGGLLAGALAAIVAGERSGRSRWYMLAGALLGGAFLTREAASVLFGLPLAWRSRRCKRALLWLAAAAAPFLVVYLAYNTALTGHPLLLPREVFDPTDRFGFGDGLGFHQRHTLAAGLVNADELLTLLQFDLFGWPPLFAFGLLLVPFLVGRAQSWDRTAAAGFLLFVLAYVGYFYHGIALGPRYYFEAVPWLLLLGASGVQRLAQLARSRLAAGLVLGALMLNCVLFYLPAEVQRRVNFSGLPNGQPLLAPLVQTSLLGPSLRPLPAPALVLTDNWWLYNALLASLNCPGVPDCPILFAFAPTAQDAAALEAAYPNRRILQAQNDNGQVVIHPPAAAAAAALGDRPTPPSPPLPISGSGGS